MIINYLKVAIRNLKRHLSFSFINILGLTLGMTLSILILLFVWNELSYDRYHKDSDNIYRITTKMKMANDEMNMPSTVAPLGQFLKEHYPNVLECVRFTFRERHIFSIDEKRFEGLIWYADSTLFDLFTIPVIQGDPQKALVNPFSLVLTESKARKFFGDENPIGKIIEADNGKKYAVSCVIEDWPANSHINYGIISSFVSLYQLNRGGPPVDSWLGINYPSYLKLADGYSPEDLEKEFPAIIEKYINSHPMTKQFDVEVSFSLQAIKDIHLYSEFSFDDGDGGSMTTVLLYSAIGIFILLIACINFMNLSTARSVNRLREVGIRKVIGAYRKQLIGQFLAESVLLSLISLILAVTLAEILLPEFNLLINQSLKISYFDNWPLTLSFFGLAILVGIIAGSYPAFYLSKFKPVTILKGKLKLGSGSAFFRNFLVVFQFVISIVLIAGTLVVFQQLDYVKNADLGFESDQVYVVPIRGDYIDNHPDIFKNELVKIAAISQVSLTSNYPGSGARSITPMRFEGFDNDEPQTIQDYVVDQNFFEMLEIPILVGRNFDPENSADKSAVIINEAIVKTTAWDNPIGKKIITKDVINGEAVDIPVTVIGVVKDFNFESLHNDIDPLIFKFGEKENGWALIKMNVDDAENVIDQVELVYSEIDNSWPFSGYFMSSRFERQYQDELRLGKTFIYFTVLAIFIAALGLFGLASFIAEQRSKEIGIRKILGSSVQSIIQKLSVNFLKLVLIASIIAIPVSWYLMDKWLQSFSYKIDLSWWVFVLAVIFALIIAFGTILFQSLKAATSNPVDAIKYE